MLSVVIPQKTESENPYVKQNIEMLKSFADVQIIQIIDSKRSRAARINDGIEQATYPMVLIIHPRSYLQPEAIAWLLEHSQEKIWGGFTHQFDHQHPLLKFTSWYSNQVRAKRSGIVYLDHCIFLHKSILGEQRPVPEVEIFEDTLLSEKLREIQRPVIASCNSTTSAIRFQRNGVVYQSALNQVLKVAFRLGASNKLLNRIYEKGLRLN